MARLKIIMPGGTGFVGRTLAARLAAARHDVRIPTRHAERHRDLLVLPSVQLIEADVHDSGVLRREFQGGDVVINLVGILNERGDARFERAHVELPRKIVEACRQTGVRRLLHMSALGARADAPSRYLRGKAAGEALVRAARDLDITVFRPSVIFGARDSFINRFARLLQSVPLVFPLACPGARMQPVFVDDVADACLVSLTDHRSFGRAYDLCGPHVYTLAEIVAYVARVIGVHRRIVPLSDVLSRAQARAFDLLSAIRVVREPPFSLDNYRSLTVDNACSGPIAAELGIHPASLEQIVPTYLGQRR